METKTTPVHPLLEGTTPGEYIIDGSSIFVLNEDGTNRISAQVQRGWESQWKDGGIRTTNEEVEAVARLFRAAPSLAAENALLAEQVERLREALVLANDCAVLGAMMHNALSYSGPDTDTFREAEARFLKAKYAKPDFTELLTSLTPASNK